MAHLDALLTFIVSFLASTTRSVSAVPCEVSLPQETSEICKAMRDKELAGKQATFTYKFDASVHGFALLNMTPSELAVLLTQDPFSRYWVTSYLSTVLASNASLYQYLSITGGKEITNISEYLPLSAFFQSFLEPAIGKYARRPSRYEAFIRKKPLWISDKYFTQQRLAGTNPMSIRQVTIHGDSAVFTPSDGDNWMLAKLNVQVTDLGYSQIVEHLAKVHYLMEPFCVSLKRTLAALHPLNQMLKYHCREIVVPNAFSTPALVGEQGFVDLLFAIGNEGALRLLRDGHQYATWEATDFRAQIKKRGLADKKLVPYFPYRDDIEEILQVIEKVAESYVYLYYDNDKDVQEDSELQAYANELSINGTGPNGGIGRIQGFPAKIDSKKDLVDIVARIISQVTIQHAAVNYELADYAVYAPNLPTKLYDDTRVKDGEFSVYRLPNRLTSAIEARFTNGLASFRFDSLFDYGNELQDIKAVNIINRHYEDLMLRVQTHMQQTNEEREKIGDLTYPYLIPRWIPNGVQT
ncbi:polyunsaturated fatty acid 5-lipoxygenase-like isoform X2 [Montipora foliosa]|uniref:polyunsaturated fatty acid 5-lipoxygenase-like isoform X2 n=1 Tax=Montipora foliosa TaxID=591990 RepID=UPI0035F133B5